MFAAGVAAGVSLAVSPALLAQAAAKGPLLTKAIPSSGEKIPIVGVGTNNYSPSDEAKRTRAATCFAAWRSSVLRSSTPRRYTASPRRCSES